MSLLASLCVHGLVISLNFDGEFVTGNSPPPHYLKGTLLTTSQEPLKKTTESEQISTPQTDAGNEKKTDGAEIPSHDSGDNRAQPQFISQPDFDELGQLIFELKEIEVTISVSSTGFAEKIDARSESPVPNDTRETLRQILGQQTYRPAMKEGKNIAGKMRIVITTEAKQQTSEQH